MKKMLLKSVVLCVSAILIMVGCKGGEGATDSQTPEIITEVTAFDIPADPRPYYEQMQIRKPMPRPDGQAILYPINISWWHCYFINGKGETVIPVGHYRNAQYIYDYDGTEKYLLCEKEVYATENGEYYPNYDYDTKEYKNSVMGYYDDGTPKKFDGKNKFDVINFNGDIVYTFEADYGYALSYGPYVVLANGYWAEGLRPEDVTVYNFEEREIYFKIDTPIVETEPGVFVAYLGNGYARYHPETNTTTYHDYDDFEPNDEPSFWMILEAINYVPVERRANSDPYQPLVLGKYYNCSDGSFIGYKNQSNGEWVYRDLKDKDGL